MTIGRYKGKDYSMGFRTGHFYLISVNFDVDNHWYWVREWPGQRFCPYSTEEKLKKNWDISQKILESINKINYFKVQTAT